MPSTTVVGLDLGQDRLPLPHGIKETTGGELFVIDAVTAKGRFNEARGLAKERREPGIGQTMLKAAG